MSLASRETVSLWRSDCDLELVQALTVLEVYWWERQIMFVHQEALVQFFLPRDRLPDMQDIGRVE